jgi:NAD(P)-dependent dehydrogenase (short-subunit alcohol dehydrogenase family)
MYFNKDVLYQSKINVAECYRRTLDTFGGLDIVINNAGILEEEHYERMIDINLVRKNDKKSC